MYLPFRRLRTEASSESVLQCKRLIVTNNELNSPTNEMSAVVVIMYMMAITEFVSLEHRADNNKSLFDLLSPSTDELVQNSRTYQANEFTNSLLGNFKIDKNSLKKIHCNNLAYFLATGKLPTIN